MTKNKYTTIRVSETTLNEFNSEGARGETSKDDKVSDGCRENEEEGPIPLNQYHASMHMQPPRFPGCRCYEKYEQAGND